MLWEPERAALLLMLLCGLPAAAHANPLQALDSLQVRTGALYLHRSDNNDDVIVRGTGAQPLLNASEFSPDAGVGWELSLIGRLRQDFALEVRFLALDNFDRKARLTQSPGGLGFAIDNTTIGLFGGGSAVVGDISYESQLYSIELNERWRVAENVDFLLGLRHVQNKETLDGLFTNSTSTNAMRFQADNFLSGVQVGLDAGLWQRGRFRIEGLARLGVYHNIVRTRYQLHADNGSSMVREWTSDNTNALSLLGELQLTGVYQICDRVALRGGYQFLCMTEIATAPNQVIDTETGLNGGPTRMRSVASDSPIYHGLSAQIEIWLHK